ncbi:PREDICTED: bidirectional sugar transporter SWEET3b-like [Tarenaya hassleriana]|uniref:bidirectional sugar transporter SWEET3b-like n=1 Tax=Tarenaya hassleriana TaxID=28532 RepID=UPI00053C3374|nr:PREDICTED: bidirectional sugar transporter SWEET3b-like [Tarenaya hassleriana]
MEERLRLAFGILANAASLMLYSSPVLTFIKMIKKRSTGDFSCIPYIVTMMTCLLWMWYGLPVVSRGLENLSLITIGCIGFTLELSFVSIFFSLASSRARIQIILTVVPLLLLACGIGAITTFAFHDHRLRKAFVGSIGDAVCVAMYASPLVAIRQVVRTKSVEFMPLHLSVFTFLTSFTWMLYGLLSKDLFIAAPNFIGCPLGIKGNSKLVFE